MCLTGNSCFTYLDSLGHGHVVLGVHAFGQGAPGDVDVLQHLAVLAQLAQRDEDVKVVEVVA